MLWHFANKPADLELLRSEPELIPVANQEFLRFFTPLPQMARTTTPETVADHLPEDRYVGISFISGNFDEDIFENPYEINLRRAKIPHLSFGFGPHTCLGNHIAEMEARVFLETIVNSQLNWQIDSADITFHASPHESVPDSFRTLTLSTLIKSEG
jgi:cytochrome P450